MSVGTPAPVTVSKTAAVDLSSSKFLGVKLDSDGKVTSTSSSLDQIYGIVQNEPVTGEAAEIAPVNAGGSSYFKLAGTLASGAQVAIDATGAGVAAASGKYTIGQLEFGGDSGDLGVVKLGFITVKA
jgi:hypothetical protein